MGRLSQTLFARALLAGMELFKGSLHYRCALPGFEELAAHRSAGELLEPGGRVPSSLAALQSPFDTGIACMAPAALEAGGSSSSSSGGSGGGASGGSSSGSGRLTSVCAASGSTCSYFVANPYHDVTSFDSVALTLIILMQGTTFDEWASPMYALMASFSPFVWVYFVLFVLVSAGPHSNQPTLSVTAPGALPRTSPEPSARFALLNFPRSIRALLARSAASS